MFFSGLEEWIFHRKFWILASHCQEAGKIIAPWSWLLSLLQLTLGQTRIQAGALISSTLDTCFYLLASSSSSDYVAQFVHSSVHPFISASVHPLFWNFCFSFVSNCSFAQRLTYYVRRAFEVKKILKLLKCLNLLKFIEAMDVVDLLFEVIEIVEVVEVARVIVVAKVVEARFLRRP